jgi:hypothetical protein
MHWIDASGARQDGPCVLVIRKTAVGDLCRASDPAVKSITVPSDQAAVTMRSLRQDVDRLNA